MAEQTNTGNGCELLDQPFAEQFAVWAIRSWVAGLKEGASNSFALQRGFDLAGISNGVVALDKLLATIATGAARSIDVRCIRCRWVSDDERAIVAALAGCQSGAPSAAKSVFECLLVPSAARIAAMHADDLASELSRARLLLRHAPSTAYADRKVVQGSHGQTVH